MEVCKRVLREGGYMMCVYVVLVYVCMCASAATNVRMYIRIILCSTVREWLLVLSHLCSLL